MRLENHISIGLGLPKSESKSQSYEAQSIRSLHKRLLENRDNRCQINAVRVVHVGRINGIDCALPEPKEPRQEAQANLP